MPREVAHPGVVVAQQMDPHHAVDGRLDEMIQYFPAVKSAIHVVAEVHDDASQAMARRPIGLDQPLDRNQQVDSTMDVADDVGAHAARQRCRTAFDCRHAGRWHRAAALEKALQHA